MRALIFKALLLCKKRIKITAVRKLRLFLLFVLFYSGVTACDKTVVVFNLLVDCTDISFTHLCP